MKLTGRPPSGRSRPGESLSAPPHNVHGGFPGTSRLEVMEQSNRALFSWSKSSRAACRGSAATSAAATWSANRARLPASNFAISSRGRHVMRGLRAGPDGPRNSRYSTFTAACWALRPAAAGVDFRWKVGFEDRLQHQHRCCHAAHQPRGPQPYDFCLVLIKNTKLNQSLGFRFDLL